MQFLRRPCMGLPITERVVTTATAPAGNIGVLTPDQIAALQRTPNARIGVGVGTGSLSVQGNQQAGYFDDTIKVATSMFGAPGGGGGGAAGGGGESLEDRIAREVLGPGAVGMGNSSLRPGQQLAPTSGGRFFAADGTPTTIAATPTRTPTSATAPAPRASASTRASEPASVAREEEAEEPAPRASTTRASETACAVPAPAEFESENARNAWIVANPACRDRGMSVQIKPKPLWPWLVGGGVAVAALAGGGIWWYSRKKE